MMQRQRHAVALCLALQTMCTNAWAQGPVEAQPTAITPPVLVRNHPPDYPASALARRQAATVLLVLDIDAQGKVTGATVKESAGAVFDEPAREAALKLEFEPARRGARAVASRILYRTRFELRVEAPPAAAPTPSSGALRGKVRVAEADTALANARIEVRDARGQSLVAFADADGSWVLATVPSGSLAVTVTAPGYRATRFEETVAPGERVDVVVRLHKETAALEVTVRGEKKPDREVTRRVLERRELALVPGTNGDALAAVQSMPGVARAQAFSGMVMVRGTAPSGTAFFVDGTPVLQAYHFGGLSSVVPTEMIEAIDFYPGNFSAKYGRVSGGVIDIRLRELPGDRKVRGMAQLDFIDARAMLSGPVPLTSAWTFSLAARRSHVDAWIGGLLSEAGSVRRAPVYYDWQAVAEHRPSAKTMFRLGWFGSDDRMAIVLGDPIPQDPGLGTGMSQHNSMMRLQAVFRSELSTRVSVSSAAAFGTDREQADFGPIDVEATYRSVTGRGALDWKVTDTVTLRAGPDLFALHYDADVISVPFPDSSQPDPGPVSARPLLHLKRSGWLTAPAGYAELEWVPERRLRFLYGGRVDYSDLTGRTELSPRFNGRYDLRSEFPRSTVKAGAGMFYEPPQPVQAVRPFGTPHLRSNRTVHYSIGFEQELSSAAEVSIEGFYKQLDNLVVRRAEADGSLGYTNLGDGSIYGAEVLLRRKARGRLFGWLAYTLSRSTRSDAPGAPERLFEYDQTHILTALGSYDLGKGWRAGARFRLVSGNPYTACLGGVLNAGTGTYSCRSGPAFGERLPPYHQADVRVDKTFRFESFSVTAYVDVYNVYNRANPELVEYNYRYTRKRYQAGLPILPSLGLRGEF